MAGSKEDSNPFSFKKFVTTGDSKKEKILEIVDDDDDDIFKVPDRRQEASKKLIISDDVGNPKKVKKKGKNENPFSFKKFLSGSSTKKGAGPSESHPVSGEQNPVFESVDNHSLPDFVQDHYHTETMDSPLDTSFDTSSNKVKKSNSSDSLELLLDLPHVGSSIKPKKTKSNPVLKSGKSIQDEKKQQQKRDESFSSSEDESSYTNKETVGNILPDFLSEVALNHIKPARSRPEAQCVSHNNEIDVNKDCDMEVNELREENVRLKEQLKLLENKRKAEMLKISDLEKQVVEQRHKEVEETSIMEKAMEQVEENLRQTTQRAVNAESTISKLKSEIKTLQGELKLLRAESGQGKADYMSDVKERTLYVAEQLVSATQTAESSLRQLLSGVDKLKLLSQVLNSIDKITEHKQSDETAGDSI